MDRHEQDSFPRSASPRLRVSFPPVSCSYSSSSVSASRVSFPAVSCSYSSSSVSASPRLRVSFPGRGWPKHQHSPPISAYIVACGWNVWTFRSGRYVWSGRRQTRLSGLFGRSRWPGAGPDHVRQNRSESSWHEQENGFACGGRPGPRGLVSPVVLMRKSIASWWSSTMGWRCGISVDRSSTRIATPMTFRTCFSRPENAPDGRFAGSPGFAGSAGSIGMRLPRSLS